MSKRFPGRHVSPLRLTVLIVVIGGLVFAGFQGWRWFADNQGEQRSPWFAAYVDVTATPFYAFEQPRGEADRDVVLSFIVADPADPCAPSWGGAYSLDDAEATLDLDRRIARVHKQGGEVLVSFGGLLNDELAVSCADGSKLVDAYASVLDRYDLAAIDLDIEGDALTNTASIERRADAIAELQQTRAEAGTPVDVWLTLPVTPDGLTPDGTDFVASMLSAGVDVAGLNIMTMDYGSSKPEQQSMGDAAVDALDATHRQLGILYDRNDTPLTDATLWSKLGVTPMIGQNDVVDEVFTLEDAATVNAFVLQENVGRTSMWSLNRDVTCGPNYYDLERVSDSCSGVDQGDQTFAGVLGEGLDGRPLNAVGATTAPESLPPVTTDDPATSPYPIWNEDTSYREGTKVVWRQNVYEAKWWTKGDVPDNPVLQEFETPWTLIGPVLPGETPIPVPTVPPGTYPEWQGDTVYNQGDRVLFDGLPYEAKWWTQGDSPRESEVDPDSSPWAAIDAADVVVAE
ncbi:chitinase [Agromyces terreus]|uniref:Chitinase n=1 Tax=Agromyces terreus TaxID=424795 RepID=A0A9X2H3Q1_9MICO|nr:carbohydrate-binding protein [Agromyces terreus]MCP2369499.1 chitinase [Agromyces terreus]